VRRRDFVAFLAGAAAAWPARAQPPPQRARIAIVHPVIPAGQLDANAGIFYRHFFAELPRLGYVEGGNLKIERYSAEGYPERYADLAREVAGTKPDLIVAITGALAKALSAASDTIPIIAIDVDPIRSGLIANLARPGGKLTGVSIDAGIEIFGKRLQILKEVIPSASRIGFFGARGEWQSAAGQVLRDAAGNLQIGLIDVSVADSTPADLRRVFAELSPARLDAIVVGSFFLGYRQLIPGLADQARIPAIYPYRDFVEFGGLVAYGPTAADIARQVAEQISQVLHGVEAGAIPFYQPVKFEFVVNLKTAQTLGLTIPPSLLARADEVIE